MLISYRYLLLVTKEITLGSTVLSSAPFRCEASAVWTSQSECVQLHCRFYFPNERTMFYFLMKYITKKNPQIQFVSHVNREKKNILNAGSATREDPESMDTPWASSIRKQPHAFREIFTQGQGYWRNRRLKIESGALRAAGHEQIPSWQPLKTNCYQMYWTTTTWREEGGLKDSAVQCLSKMVDWKGHSSAVLHCDMRYAYAKFRAFTIIV